MSEIKKCQAKDPSKCRYHGRQVAEVSSVNANLAKMKLANYSREEYNNDASALIVHSLKSRLDSDRMVAYRQHELLELMKKDTFSEYWLTDGAGSYKVYRDFNTGIYRVYDQKRVQNKVDVVEAINEGLKVLAAKVVR